MVRAQGQEQYLYAWGVAEVEQEEWLDGGSMSGVGMSKEKEKMEKGASALLRMGQASHKRPRKPTKRDLERGFKMMVDRKGNPRVVEVE